MLLALIGATVAWATPDADALREAWEAQREALDAHAVYPITWTDNEWKKIAKGGVAKRRERLDGADRVLGMIWVASDLDSTWLAVQDSCGQIIDGFHEELLPGSTVQNKLVYQSIKLPWPLQARQWVIRVQNNGTLIAATENKLWERTWGLDPTRGATAELDGAVWLPVNDGGWYWAEAEGGTLLAYHVRSVIGGAVPDDVATRWSFGTLGGMLKRAAGRAPDMAEHYDPEHAPMTRPDGTPIPLPAAP